MMVHGRGFRGWLIVFFVGCLGCVTGCSRQQQAAAPVVAEARDAGRDTSPADADKAAATGPITLREADLDVYQEVLGKHRGQVVLVDFWATWCVPCKQHFPDNLALGRQYHDRGLAVVSVSLDDPSDRPEILKFLNSVGARIDNLVSKWGGGTESAEQFQFDGAVPFYRLYDRTGTLRYEFSGIPEGLENVEGIDQIEPRVKELLATPGSASADQ